MLHALAAYRLCYCLLLWQKLSVVIKLVDAYCPAVFKDYNFCCKIPQTEELWTWTRKDIGDWRQSKAGLFSDGFAAVGNSYETSRSGRGEKVTEVNVNGYAHENLIV